MKVLFWTDLHAPFAHKDALKFLTAVNKKYKPNVIVMGGDEVDNYGLSDYEKDPAAMNTSDELAAAIKQLRGFYKLFPKALVCTSNHVERIERKRKEVQFPKKLMRSWNEVLEAPAGWKWGESFHVDGVTYEHGHRLSGTGAKATTDLPLSNGMSTAFGHFHSHAGLLFTANKESLLFGLNAGCLVDIHSYGMAYGKKCKNRPVLGCAIIIDGIIPIFIPMVLNRRSRWIGKL